METNEIRSASRQSPRTPAERGGTERRPLHPCACGRVCVVAGVRGEKEVCLCVEKEVCVAHVVACGYIFRDLDAVDNLAAGPIARTGTLNVDARLVCSAASGQVSQHANAGACGGWLAGWLAGWHCPRVRGGCANHP